MLRRDWSLSSEARVLICTGVAGGDDKFPANSLRAACLRAAALVDILAMAAQAFSSQYIVDTDVINTQVYTYLCSGV